jgi:hypothetical protein
MPYHGVGHASNPLAPRMNIARNNPSLPRRVSAAARARDMGLTQSERRTLGALDTPQKIQAYLTRITVNHELGGETILSVRKVLRQRRAHCIEGAFVAACALWLHGEPPLLVHLDCDISDYPHVIAVFRRGSFWGAISKTNGTPLRYRDPVYRSLRELTMSYFHEYYNKKYEKTLRSYSRAFDLRTVDPALWITCEENCWEIHDRLLHARHFPLVSTRQAKSLALRDSFERKASKFVQYPRPPRGTTR